MAGALAPAIFELYALRACNITEGEIIVLRASDMRLRRVNNATVGGYTSSVTYGATANIAEGNFDAACRFPLQGEG